MKFLVSLDNGKLYNVSLNSQRDDDQPDEANKPLVIKDVLLEEKPSSKIIHMSLLNKELVYFIFANGEICFYEYSIELQEDSSNVYTNYNMIRIEDLKHRLRIELNDERILQAHKVNRKSKKPIQYNTAAISQEELNKDIILVADLIKTDKMLILTTKSGRISFVCLKTFEILFDFEVPCPLSFVNLISFDSNVLVVALGGYENLLKILTFDIEAKSLKEQVNTKPMKFNEKLNLPYPNWPVFATKMIANEIEYYIEVTKFGFLKFYNLEKSKKPIGDLKDLLLNRPFQKNMQPVISKVLVEDLGEESKKKLILTDNVNSIWELTLTINDSQLTVKQEGKINKSVTGHINYLEQIAEVSELPQHFEIVQKQDTEEEIKPLNKDEVHYLNSKTNFIKDSQLLLYSASSRLNVLNRNTNKNILDWLLNSKVNTVLVYDSNDVLTHKKYDKYVNRLIRKRGLSVEEKENEDMWNTLEKQQGKTLKKQKRE